MRVDLPSVETPPATKAAVDTAATTPPSEKATSDSAPQPPTAPSAASVSQNSAGVGASSVTGSIRAAAPAPSVAGEDQRFATRLADATHTGRASGREKRWQYVQISAGPVT